MLAESRTFAPGNQNQYFYTTMQQRTNINMFAMPQQRSEQLTKHFKLKDFTRSGTAIRYGLPNEPDDLAYQNLYLLTTNVFEPMRRRFGVIRITSGYRSKEVNEAEGGDEFSQHRYGQEADIFIPNQEVGKKVFDFIRQNLTFDILVYEYDKRLGRHIIHVSYNAENNRKQTRMEYKM